MRGVGMHEPWWVPSRLRVWLRWVQVRNPGLEVLANQGRMAAFEFLEVRCDRASSCNERTASVICG